MDDDDEDIPLGFVNFNRKHPAVFRKFTKHNGVSSVNITPVYVIWISKFENSFDACDKP
jgi:hypothetical protein